MIIQTNLSVKRTKQVIYYLETGKTQLKTNNMEAKEFIKTIENEFDVETLELMKSLIEKRLTLLNTMMDVATRKQIKGFRR